MRKKHHGFSAAAQVTARHQRGMVLPVALVALLAATMLTLAFVRSNMTSLKIGGASVVTAETRNAADLVLSGFFGNSHNSLIEANVALYAKGYTPCETTSSIGADVFDCRKIDNSHLPSSTTANPIAVQRDACTSPPRSDKPSSTQYRSNYNHLVTGVQNAQFGSFAEVGSGVGVFAIQCPTQ